MPEDETAVLMHAAPMHDIGKIATPDAVLLKPGKLDAAEWEIMKQHPTVGLSDPRRLAAPDPEGGRRDRPPAP